MATSKISGFLFKVLTAFFDVIGKGDDAVAGSCLAKLGNEGMEGEGEKGYKKVSCDFDSEQKMLEIAFSHDAGMLKKKIVNKFSTKCRRLSGSFSVLRHWFS